MPTRRFSRPSLALPLTLLALASAPSGAAAATPIDLGPASHAPRLAAEESGVGHVTWASPGDEALHYCRLSPGLTGCASSKTFPPIVGDEPYDLGNAPLVAPNRALILDVRSNPAERKILYSSSDGFNSPSTLATASVAESAWISDAAFAPAGTVNAKERILTVQSGAVTNGGKFQALSTSGAETTTASFSLSNGDDTCAESVARVGGIVYGAFINCDVAHPETAYLRRYVGDGALANLNDKGKWSAPGAIGAARSNIALAGGPSGLYVAYDRPGDKAVVLRRFDSPNWSAPVVLGISDNGLGWFALFQDSAGVLHFSWEENGNLLYRYGRDATNSSFTNPQTLASGANFDEQRIGVNAAGNGWISWLDFASGHALALPLAPGEPTLATPPTPGAPTPGPAKPSLYKGPTKTASKALGHGLRAALTTPKKCVGGGLRFAARLAVKRKGTQAHKASYTVKKVKFSLGGRTVSIDRDKPFETTFSTTGVRAGTTLSIAAKVSVKLRKRQRWSNIGKTLKASVKTCD